MKDITQLLSYFGAALAFAALITANIPLGVIAVGVWAFAFVYDPNFRKLF